MEESRLYFLFFEKELTFFSQGTNGYAYREGRVDLDILAYFKAEHLRCINHLSSNGFGYDELSRMYLKWLNWCASIIFIVNKIRGAPL